MPYIVTDAGIKDFVCVEQVDETRRIAPRRVRFHGKLLEIGRRRSANVR